MNRIIVFLLLLTLLTPGCIRRKTKFVSPNSEGLKTGVWNQSNWNEAKWGAKENQ